MFELSDDLKTKLEDLRDKISTLLSEIQEFSKAAKAELEISTIKYAEEKSGFKIGDDVRWRGVRAKIVGFDKDMPKVSIYISSEKTSFVEHTITYLHDIEKCI